MSIIIAGKTYRLYPVRSRAPLLQKLVKPSIRRRLALGYVLTIAIAAAGIQVGQKWAYHRVREPAQKQLEAAYKRGGHLGGLQKSLLGTKGSILPYIQKPALLDSYQYHLITNSQQLQHLIDELEVDYLTSLKENASTSSKAADRKDQQAISEQSDTASFLSLCKDAGSSYEQALNALFVSIEEKKEAATAQANPAESQEAAVDNAVTSALLSSIAINESVPNSELQLEETQAGSKTSISNQNDIQPILLNFLSVEPAQKLDRCALALESLTFQNQYSILQASSLLEEAIQIQSRVTNVTLLLSLIAAIALALYSSWSITRPLTALSKISHQVSQSSDFDVRIPVEINDEVGVLAASLNNLIHRARLLLKEQKAAQQQLETYNQTLETAVQARSQEILEKNSRLENMVKDLHETQSQLVQAEKMSSLGQLVAGIAHEINNPVNFIHGNLQHAEDYFQDLLEMVNFCQSQSDRKAIEEKAQALELEYLSEDVIKLLKSMRLGTERIREIVLSLRSFSRLDESDLKTADLHEGIDSTLLILTHRLKASNTRPAIDIVKHYGKLPLIECFPGQLNQVFMNVLANAIDAFESAEIQQPQITISTTQIKDNVRISISDNGPGVPKEIQHRIFEPFFTTKDVGKGTTFTIELPIKR